MADRGSDRLRLGFGVFAVVSIAALTLWMWLSPPGTAVSPVSSIPAGEPAQREAPDPAPTRTLRGRVVDAESGAGVAGARLTAGGREVGADGGGGFALEVGATAKPEVSATAEGWFSAKALASDDEELVIELRQKVVVEGEVRAVGGPVGGAALSAVWLSGHRAAELEGGVEELGVQTGADGRFRLELPAGRVRLLAEATGFALGESREIRLVGGRPVKDVVIDVTARGDLVVRVVDEGGGAVGGARVEVLGMPSWLKGRVETDALGLARLEGLPIGEQRLRVSASRFSTTDSAAVQIEADREVEVSVTLAPLAGVSGRVEAHTGIAVSGALVVLAPEKLPTATSSVMTGADGRFRFVDLEVGVYLVSASHPYYAATEAVRVESGGEVTIRLGKGGDIEGEVVDREGRAVGGATVVVETFRPAEGTPGMAADTSLGGRHFRPAPATADGHFLLTELAPGRYDLLADCEGYGAGKVEGVAVYAGRSTTGVRITCDEGAWLSGRVLDATNRSPLGGATVVVQDLDRNALGLSTLSVTTEPDGSFAIAGLQGGRRSVVVSREGYRTRIEAGLELAPRREMEREILLAPAGEGPPQVEFFGIGATLEGTAEGTVRILKTLDGSPASRNGLQVGDEILRVDGQDVSVLGLGRTVELIRGEEDTEVDLEVRRKDDPYPVHVKLARGRVVYEGSGH